MVKEAANYAKDFIVEGQKKFGWWGLIMSTSVVALAAILLIHLMHACGWGPFAGQGFAQAADLNEVRADLIARDIDLVDYTICTEDAVDPQLVNYRESKLDEYREVTGREYNHKPCTLLLKIIR